MNYKDIEKKILLNCIEDINNRLKDYLVSDKTTIKDDYCKKQIKYINEVYTKLNK